MPTQPRGARPAPRKVAVATAKPAKATTTAAIEPLEPEEAIPDTPVIDGVPETDAAISEQSEELCAECYPDGWHCTEPGAHHGCPHGSWTYEG